MGWQSLFLIATERCPMSEPPKSPDLASRIVDVAALPWTPTKFPGIDVKLLFEDKASGMLTALFRWAPGARLPLHEHVEIEQSFVLEGAFEDDEGEITAGNFVSRPAGSRHAARSPRGAIVLAMFLKPNVFISEDGTREAFAARSD
jgi:anti-sigma factor ChrR (cupin superfamily)